MPIFDVTASVATAEIGKIFDVTSAAATAQIQSVWDITAAGTTSKVYDAESLILSGATSYYGAPAISMTDADTSRYTYLSNGAWTVEGNGRVQAGLTTAISFTGYSKLYFTVSANNVSTMLLLGYTSAFKSWIHASSSTYMNVGPGSTGTFSMTVPSSGGYYVQAQVLSPSVTRLASITKIWLE